MRVFNDHMVPEQQKHQQHPWQGRARPNTPVVANILAAMQHAATP